MKWVLLLLVLGVAGWWAWDRLVVTDEKRVAKQLSALVKAVETGNLLKLEDGIAQGYSDDFGFDKSTIIGGIRSFRAQHDALLIILSELAIEVAADRQTAEAVFIAKVLAKPKGSLTETEIRADRFRLHFRNIDGAWKMTRAESPELKFE